MKIADLRRRVLEEAIAHTESFGYSPDEDARAFAELAVDRAIKAVGLEVATDGEIYNPAPDPKFMPPGMEPKWGGGARRRRR
jgi:hypothetical protein